MKKYVWMTLGSVLLFMVEHKYATRVRGYEAYGGEVLTLLFPLLYALSASTFREWFEDVKKLYEKSVSRSGKITD